MFSLRNQCPKRASGVLPLVVDLGCGYIYVMGCRAYIRYEETAALGSYLRR